MKKNSAIMLHYRTVIAESGQSLEPKPGLTRAKIDRAKPGRTDSARPCPDLFEQDPALAVPCEACGS